MAGRDLSKTHGCNGKHRAAGGRHKRNVATYLRSLWQSDAAMLTARIGACLAIGLAVCCAGRAEQRVARTANRIRLLSLATRSLARAAVW